MRAPVTPENQGVTFVELFFDLAFVFAVTQTVGLFHHGLHFEPIAQGVVVFWLVWWAWTQFTWTLNSADTTTHTVMAATLTASALAFFMAVGLPDAFHGNAFLFAIPYVAIRGVGLALYLWVASADQGQKKAVQTFTLASVGGLIAVLGGAIAGGTTQLWLWGLTIFLDIIALMVAAQSESWTVRPGHFCERHGLFVIIALGETLIVAAVGMKEIPDPSTFFMVGVLSIGTICGMWWLYFAHLKAHMDAALQAASGDRLTAIARDAYSLLHFFILGGIVALAIAIESAMAHRTGPIGPELRLAAAVSAALFGGGTVLAFLRVTGRLLVPRLILTLVVLATIALSTTITPFATLAIAFVAIVTVGAIEHRSFSRRETTDRGVT